MMNKHIYLQKTLKYDSLKTYIFTAIFVVANIILPQIAHFVPNGGKIFLPIYFFTIIASFQFGTFCGLLTAILSPILNHVLFGMPPITMLPIITIKSVLIVVATFFIKKKFFEPSFLVLTMIVFSYQILGSIIEWALTASFEAAVQDFTLGFAGMASQIVLGYLVLKNIQKYVR